ncbi:substrate-binding domain-containing protein [Streptomyces sp. NPDC046862]|uniref:substrate-binding domain-containing protein n=1 Tax=Streptomyces sp. NPDC046862 TaxID=3154603 RepID=UPI0034522AAB
MRRTVQHDARFDKTRRLALLGTLRQASLRQADECRRTGRAGEARRVSEARRVGADHGDNTEDAGERAARQLLGGTELPSAVVAFNDQCAIGVLTALGRAGDLVPGAVSVAGYDDDALSRLSCFNLTTVSRSAEEQARHAVTAALERLDEGRTEPREIVLPLQLVVRGTTAPAA